MYEHKYQALISPKKFIVRMLKHLVVTGSLIFLSLGIGILGYRIFVNLSWIDSLLNASMILSGMGPVNPITPPIGKIFASGYALFSGVIFMAAVGIIITPIAHRIIHRIQIDERKAAEKKEMEFKKEQD